MMSSRYWCEHRRNLGNGDLRQGAYFSCHHFKAVGLLVPITPGVALWAITGHVGGFVYGCLAYFLIDQKAEINGWMKLLIVVSGLSGATFAIALRQRNWNWRKALWVTATITETWLRSGTQSRPRSTEQVTTADEKTMKKFLGAVALTTMVIAGILTGIML